MKKLAVIVCGWHFPETFYRQVIEQKKPSGWQIDYFCVSHRNPKNAIGEKQIDKNSKDLYEKLDYFLYKNTATKDLIEDLGWVYMDKPNTLGDWGVFNQWVEDYNYKEYDLIYLSGDDNLFVNDNLFECVLDEKFETWFSNGDVGNHVISEVPYSNDWLILSHSIHRGRGILRGSLEFFKPEIFDMLGGKFDFKGCDLEYRIGKTKSPPGYKNEIINWNYQCIEFMHFIEKNNLYDKIRFLSCYYRTSVFCIEGERGYISYSNIPAYDPLYRKMVEFLHDEKILDKFIE